MRNKSSQEKLHSAIEYACYLLETKGINISTDEVRGAIERAVVEFNK